MARRGEQRLAETLLDHASLASCLADLLTGDARRAEILAHRALDDAAIRRLDLHRRDALELYIVRRLIALCPPDGRPPPELASGMEAGERAFFGLARRRRMAAALALGLGLSDLGVAEVLRCSERTARGLRERAVREWGRLSGAGPAAEERLRGILERRAREAPTVSLGPREVRRLGRTRRLVAVATPVLAALVAVGSGAGGRALLSERSTAPPEAVRAPSSERLISAEPLPLNSFGWCPDVGRARPFGRRPARSAARAAARFNMALLRKDVRTLAALVDDIPHAASLNPRRWEGTKTGRGLAATSSSSASSDGRAVVGCGQRVAARTWKVVLRDAAAGQGGAGYASFYLVRRPAGWKVWGSY